MATTGNKLSFGVVMLALVMVECALASEDSSKRAAVLAMPSNRRPLSNLRFRSNIDLDSLSQLDPSLASLKASLAGNQAPFGLYWCLSVCSSQWISRCPDPNMSKAQAGGFRAWLTGEAAAASLSAPMNECQMKFRDCSRECRQAYKNVLPKP